MYKKKVDEIIVKNNINLITYYMNLKIKQKRNLKVNISVLFVD